jgi:secreted Zn-dependent insulinase-like peptidase
MTSSQQTLGCASPTAPTYVKEIGNAVVVPPGASHHMVLTASVVVLLQEHVGPAVIMDTAHVRCWHKLDDRFLLPKAIVRINITAPEAYASPRNAVLTGLFTELVRVCMAHVTARLARSPLLSAAHLTSPGAARCLQESLAEYTYAADVAGLSYTLDNTTYGIALTVHGYSHKLAVLLQRVISAMLALTVDDATFTHIKDLVCLAYAATQPGRVLPHRLPARRAMPWLDE